MMPPFIQIYNQKRAKKRGKNAFTSQIYPQGKETDKTTETRASFAFALCGAQLCFAITKMASPPLHPSIVLYISYLSKLLADRRNRTFWVLLSSKWVRDHVKHFFEGEMRGWIMAFERGGGERRKQKGKKERCHPIPCFPQNLIFKFKLPWMRFLFSHKSALSPTTYCVVLCKHTAMYGREERGIPCFSAANLWSGMFSTAN